MASTNQRGHFRRALLIGFAASMAWMGLVSSPAFAGAGLSSSASRTAEAADTSTAGFQATVVSGLVLVRRPGEQTFTRLVGSKLLPFGTTLDLSKGRVSLDDLPDGEGPPEATDFWGGVVEVTRSGEVVLVTLTGGDFSVCDAPRAAQARRNVRVRRVFGSGKGKFGTRGRHAATRTRGTSWQTADFCDGTRISVTDGSVWAIDLELDKPVLVGEGESYFGEGSPPNPPPPRGAFPGTLILSCDREVRVGETFTCRGALFPGGAARTLQIDFLCRAGVQTKTVVTDAVGEFLVQHRADDCRMTIRVSLIDALGVTSTTTTAQTDVDADEEDKGDEDEDDDDDKPRRRNRNKDRDKDDDAGPTEPDGFCSGDPSDPDC